MMIFAQLVVLLIVANGAPVLLRYLLGAPGHPVDGGLMLSDGRYLLGGSKTWRGLIVAILAAGLVSGIMGLGWWFGLAFGLAAMLGDLLSSFAKRRLGLEAGDRALGLDQLPEALLPTLLAIKQLDAGWVSALGAAVVFTLLNVWGSPLLYRLGIRHRPH